MRKFIVNLFLRFFPKWLLNELFYAYYLKEVYNNNNNLEKQQKDFFKDAVPHISEYISKTLDNKSRIEHRNKIRNLMRTISQEEIDSGLLSEEDWNNLKIDFNKLYNQSTKNNIPSSINPQNIKYSLKQNIELGKPPTFVG